MRRRAKSAPQAIGACTIGLLALIVASAAPAATGPFRFIQPKSEICVEGTQAITVGVRQSQPSSVRVVFISIYDKRNLVFHRMVIASSRWQIYSYDPPALPIYGSFGEAAYPTGGYRIVYRVGKQRTIFRTSVIFCGD